MSSVLSGGEVQENRVVRGKRAKAGSLQPPHSSRRPATENPINPQKSLTTPLATPLATPRKALGDISNSAITPALARNTQNTIKKARAVGKNPGVRGQKAAPKSQLLASARGKDGAVGTKPAQASVSATQQQFTREEDLPPIESMPQTGNPDNVDAPFVPPPYFQNLTRALRYNPPCQPHLHILESFASLSLSTNIRPTIEAGSSLMAGPPMPLSVTDTSGSISSAVDLPDMPDFSDL